MIAVTIAGVMGSFADSALGYFEEKGIGNKYTSNFICGLVAGLASMALFAML